MSAVIYTRVSDSSGEASTGRQEALCRAWIEGQGGHVACVIDEGLTSAWAGRPRSGFDRLFELVSRREVDAVVVWRVDRLVRSPADYERLLGACRRSGVAIRSVTEPVDASDPMGVAAGRLFALVAGLESDVKSSRLKARSLEKAQAGALPNSGVFGLAADGESVIEDEAMLIREAAARVLAGESLRQVVEDWRGRGVQTRSRRAFRTAGLRRLLMNPALVGDRALRGRVVATGCWPPILDRLSAARVRNQLASGSRDSYRRPVNHLLAGLVACGACGGRMVPTDRHTVRPRYRCHHALQCRQMSISQHHLETWVTSQVLSRLQHRADPANRSWWDQGDVHEGVEALDHCSAVLASLNRAHYVNAQITYTEWIQLRDDLALRTERAVARAGPPRPPGLDPAIPLWQAAEHWQRLGLQTQRDILAVELHKVVVNPPIRGRWHANRAVPIWILPDPGSWALTSGPRYGVSNKYGTWDLTANPRRRPRPR